MSPFDVGQQFEDFVEKRIFNSSDYVLVEKTHNYDQNHERFVESSNNPDFKFRPRSSSQEFYVEAKYRSGFNAEDKLDLFKTIQYYRFKEMNSIEHPVFLIVGVGGSPANPDILSFIPMTDIKYVNLFKSVILTHRISKTGYKPDNILSRINELFPENKSTQINSQTFYETRSERKFKPIYMGISILIMFLLILGYNSLTISDLPPAQNLKSKIESYYDILEHNNIALLDHYLNDKIDRWYDHSNVNAEFVKHDAATYNEKYPIRQINVEWATYQESRLPNGYYSVSYYLIYKIKANQQSAFKTYFLNIKAIWDRNLKLRSMYEEKIN